MNHVSGIIIIKRIKTKKKKRNVKKGCGENENKRERILFLFLLFVFFSDLRKSDRRFSSGLKAKLIHVGLHVGTKSLEFR